MRCGKWMPRRPFVWACCVMLVAVKAGMRYCGTACAVAGPRPAVTMVHVSRKQVCTQMQPTQLPPWVRNPSFPSPGAAQVWFVEEQDLLALALNGHYIKHRAPLKCPSQGGAAGVGADAQLAASA